MAPRWRLTFGGIGAATALLLGIAVLSYLGVDRLLDSARLVEHTHIVNSHLDETLARLTSAETGQRGFLITGEDRYLEPYRSALPLTAGLLESLERLIEADPRQRERVIELERLVSLQFELLEQGIELRRRDSRQDALVASGLLSRSKDAMDGIRTRIAEMKADELRLLSERSDVVARDNARIKAIIVLGNLAAFLLLGAAFGFLGREIARRARAEQAIVSHAARLEAANKELESFSYSVSHDLRSPLRAIDGFSRIVEEDYGDRLDDEGKRLLRVIRENGVRMGQLIDDLLQFSRLGRKPINSVPLDMNALAAEAYEEARTAAPEKEPHIVLHSLPAASGDRGLIKQVWANLLENAIKYSSTREKPVIEVSGEKKGKEVHYRVRDNGVGFDMAYAHKLFSVFQRLHASTEFSGTGVGLAIVHRIVTRHGGRVWAEGKPGEGAVFHFTLPAAGGA
jgi:signal transduction histidine kinase